MARYIGAFCMTLMVFGYFFGITLPNGYVLGDAILSRMGLAPWSNATTGLHYTVLYSGAIIAVSWLGTVAALRKRQPHVVATIPIFLALLMIGTPLLLGALAGYSGFKPLYK